VDEEKEMGKLDIYHAIHMGRKFDCSIYSRSSYQEQGEK
jgi:hypothetical protein